MADAGGVMAGRFGQEALGVAQMLFFVFVMASHLLTFNVAFNSITNHATCSIVFGVVGMVISFICSIPRTLQKMSWLSLVCKSLPTWIPPILTRLAFTSIFASVIVTMIAVGIQHPGDTIKATVETDLYHGFTAVTNIVFAFCKLPTLSIESGSLTNKPAGHAAFFHLMAELENPRDYPKALCLLQGIDISLYVLAAVVIYCYAGESVTSPALGSAGPIVSRVAYGIALPTVRSPNPFPPLPSPPTHPPTH